MIKKASNFLLDTDSYKVSHFDLYPRGTERVYSYFESRGGRFKETVFFGLQYILARYFEGIRVTTEAIDEAQALLDVHLSKGAMNRAGWEHIRDAHKGLLPLSIKAVPEGSVVPTRNVLMTVENTCPQCAWLTNYAETMLVQAWFPSTVSSISREAKRIILRYLERTGDPSLVDFKLHDFGFRGVSSHESAGIGGCAHLVNFKGTDTLAALTLARDYYHEPCAGFSIPATEHSVVTINGPDGELDQFRRVLALHPTGLVACVSDSYDIYRACREYWGGVLKADVLARDGTLVVRPDSGYPPKVVREVHEILWERFGGFTNQKGYKVLDPHVRVIQGDGVNLDSIEECLHQLQQAGFSADNLAFGMGGALLQQCDRDTQRFAFKCSWRQIAGNGADVWKSPVTDGAKDSKRGRLGLVKFHHGPYKTVAEADVPVVLGKPADELVEVFRNGAIVREWSLADVRARAALVETPTALTV